MFSQRWSPRAARVVREAARRGHTSTVGTRGSARPYLLTGGAILVASSVTYAYSRSLPSAACAPSAQPSVTEAAAAVAQAAAAPSPNPGEKVEYYQPTSSRLAQLPQTPSEIASQSLTDLGSIFDRHHTSSSEVLSHVAHTVAWGTPAPPDGLAPLELLFTSADEDPMHRHMELLVRTIQDRVCNEVMDMERLGGATLESVDGVALNDSLRLALLNQRASTPGQFRQDIIIRPNGTGGGITRVLDGGRVFAKAGVSVSVADVKVPPQFIHRMAGDHPRLLEHNPTVPYRQFTAAVSLVLHPVSPHVPTVHMNYRIFDLTMPDGKRVWWFGGGSDLTPTYVVDSDCVHFHRTIKGALDAFDSTYYPSWKLWADKYFYLPHRDETRGVGGVFFDDLHERDQAHYEKVIRRLGEAFSAQYFPIVMKNKDKPFTLADLNFQQLRRGRYTEFNLVYDKGTTYGLRMLNSRPDAVLMSIPPIARAMYKQPFDTKEQAYTKEVLQKPKDWC